MDILGWIILRWGRSGGEPIIVPCRMFSNICGLSTRDALETTGTVSRHGNIPLPGAVTPG